MTGDALIEGRYRLVALAGKGASGRVLEVIDTAGGERRAMKIVPRGPHEALLLAEFAQLARLEHPSLPRVFEVGRLGAIAAPLRASLGPAIEAGAPYFLAEWIAGTRSDAPDLARDGAALWSLLADIAGALAAMHGAGLVHADVAPQNVLVTTERAVLVDLGLADLAASASSESRGTPAYMAPEAFTGRIDARSDLYSLGATAIRVATGRPPVEAATLGELVQRIVGGAARPDLSGLPRPLVDLLLRLIAREPDARPASAIAVLEELDSLAPVLLPAGARAPAPRSPDRRARGAIIATPAANAWPGAEAWLDAFAHAGALGAPTPFVAVVGPAAAGGRALVEVALRRRQLEAVAAGASPTAVIRGDLAGVASALGVAEVGREAARGWIERVARAIRRAAAPVVLQLHGDPRARELLAAISRAPGAAPVIALVDDEASARDLAVLRPAPVLDVAAVGVLAAQLLGSAPKRAWIEALHAASGGLAEAVIELVRAAATERDPTSVDLRARAARGATELHARALRAVSAAGQHAAVQIAAWGGAVAVEDLVGGAAPLPLAALADLDRAGLVRLADGTVAMDRAVLDAVAEVRGADAIAIAAADILDGLAATHAPERVAALYERAALTGERAARACDVAEALLARGRADRALALATRAIAALPARAGLVAARAATATAAYREAMRHARAAATHGADGVEAALIVARAAQRAGDLDAAEQTLATLHAAHPQHAEAAGAYARLLVTRARFAEARTVATAGGPLAGLRAEAAGLAAFYLGELDAADAAFAALEATAQAADDALSGGRALSLRGMVAQQRGRLALASDRYREAAARFAELGEVHAAAVAELNLGTVLAERGRASEALPRLVAASRVFEELGATTELIAADLNRGNALLAVGQAAEARDAARSALARAAGAPHLRAFALLVAGDAHRRLGELDAAIHAYRDALAIGTERRDTHAQVSAHIALAEAGIAPPAGVDVGTACASDDDRDRWTLARARLALAIAARAPGSAGLGARPIDGSDGRPRAAGDAPGAGAGEGPGALASLAVACADVAARATAADRLERAFRAHSLAARCAAAAADRARAQSEAERARTVHAALLAAAAPAFRAAVAADPDLVALAAVVPPPAPTDVAPTPRGDATAHVHLRRLLTLSRRLNTETSVERILDEVIDTAIELTSAERGFLLLRASAPSTSAELVPVVSRNFDESATAAGTAPTVSRSIAERAAQTGEPVLTVDAGIDERFGAAASVAALRLRSVLAVPLRQRGSVIGCIYVDHRLRGGAFDDAAASLLGELADIAAIAIENARLTANLKATTADVDALAARLSADLADRDAELVRVRAELPERERLRHRYERIIGRSPAMLRMLDIVDRATATALPVVVVGESGTGKELIARALHDHGPRKAGAFVAINCSAVPEQLLESELFGHVRGAFTGADRDRRGLFEVADGGTLFLDEVADTSAAMQAKLLRVLQDGQIRRVGDTKTHSVDVRVIAATQRPLAELVAAGRFREDLRFRLEVIAIPIPPLREREGDLPLLVEALLARAGTAAGKAPKITKAALRALTAHRWPGNIRELENALARGAAMGGDVIDLEDLPEAIAAAAARPEPARPTLGEDLRLKPALAATELAYVTAAMERAKNNQTVAARLLGLSRFGLQKKLRRLAGEPDAETED